MKTKILSVLVGMSVLCGSGLAGMEDTTICNDQSLANAASYANSVFMRGDFRGIFVKIEDCASAVRTNTVALTTADGQTLFSANVVGTSTNFYPVVGPTYTTGGAGILVGDAPAGSTNILYRPIPVASKVTCTVTGAAFPTLTNSVTVRLLWDTL